MKIQQITGQEVTRLVEIVHGQPFSAQWTLEDFKSEIDQRQSLLLGIYEEKQLVGFIALREIIDFCEITNFAIDVPYCKKGYGTALLTEALKSGLFNGIKHFTLEVHERNFPAIGLYKKFNFAPVGKRKSFYKDNGDALIMEFKK